MFFVTLYNPEVSHRANNMLTFFIIVSWVSRGHSDWKLQEAALVGMCCFRYWQSNTIHLPVCESEVLSNTGRHHVAGKSWVMLNDPALCCWSPAVMPDWVGFFHTRLKMMSECRLGCHKQFDSSGATEINKSPAVHILYRYIWDQHKAWGMFWQEKKHWLV